MNFKNHILNLDVFGEQYSIFKSEHIKEKRDNEKEVREYLLNNKRYKEIFEKAIKNGISQFKNKGRIAISFKTEESKIMTILCILEEKNITIITIVNNNKSIHERFNSVKNFIYIQDYILPNLTNDELIEKDMEKLALVLFKNEGKYNQKKVLKSHRKPLKIKKRKGKIVINHKNEQINFEKEDNLFLNKMNNIKKI
jgi:hypothetical protein